MNITIDNNYLEATATPLPKQVLLSVPLLQWFLCGLWARFASATRARVLPSVSARSTLAWLPAAASHSAMYLLLRLFSFCVASLRLPLLSCRLWLRALYRFQRCCYRSSVGRARLHVNVCFVSSGCVEIRPLQELFRSRARHTCA